MSPRAKVARDPDKQINKNCGPIGLNRNFGKEIAGSEIDKYNTSLSDETAEFYSNPLGFVLFAYPWGEPGSPLEAFQGPDGWQRDFLIELGEEIQKRSFRGNEPVEPIRMARSSGRGIGKSALVGMLTNFLMSTRADCRGTLTATSFQQLSTKTWAAVHYWNHLSITGHWFKMSGEKMYHSGKPNSWFCTPQTCKEENSQAFAGQHAATSTNFYLFDEGSGIPDKIYEVAEAGMTDGESIILVFGNPTRAQGKFFDICFGEKRDRWRSKAIDSRECGLPNKKEIAENEKEYGEDSDWFRVWVRGMPPRASDLQFIDSATVREAQRRQVHVLPDEPLVLGIDVARGGEDANVLRFRRGLDARTIAPVRIPGGEVRDSMILITKIVDVIEKHKPKAVFLDATGGSIGGPIGDRIRQMGYKVIDVQFGGKPPDDHYANMRSWMWAKMRDWLEKGAIEKDYRLELDLVGPTASHNRRDRMILEPKESMKARGLHSPDDADSLALTFAMPVGVEVKKRQAPVAVTAWS